MDPNESSRRYSREEMRRILEAASQPESPRADPPTNLDGFTLAEIMDIAGEVGIDPIRVERASRALPDHVKLAPTVSVGTYQLERSFARLLTADEMRFVAQEADRYFSVEGQLRQTRGYLEWHSADARAFVGLVNESGRTRVRVILDRASQFLFGGALISVLGLTALLEVASGLPGVMGIVGATGVIAATFVAVAGFWKWRGAAALRRIEGLLKLMMDGPVSLPAGGDDT